MTNHLFFLILMIFFSGCAIANSSLGSKFRYTSYSKIILFSHPEDYQVGLFFEDNKPERKYQEVGEIKGIVEQEYNLNQAIEQEVRRIGADAAIEIKVTEQVKDQPSNLTVKQGILPGENDPVFTPGYMYKIYKINAKVIKYTD